MAKMKRVNNPSDMEEMFREDRFRVTIFGGARVKKGDKEYNDIFLLAKMIGERGIDIVTGGGPGIMEAANLGHALGQKKSKKKAISIGLGIKLPHEQGFNEGVNIRVKYKRFSNRLDNFMLLSNIVVVAPGGVGTMLELFYTWQLVQVKHVCHIPIILMGDMWIGLLKWLKEEPLKKQFFAKEDYNLLFHSKKCKDAIKVIDDSYKEFKKGNKDFCINYKKYRY